MYKIICMLLLFVSSYLSGTAQTKQAPLYRIAHITVDSHFITQYKQALQEQMTAAIRLEPGVLSYTAMTHKTDSTQFTILEVYAHTQAYQQHIQTPHFKKYKETVKNMVTALELIDTDWVITAKQPNFK